MVKLTWTNPAVSNGAEMKTMSKAPQSEPLVVSA